MESTPFSGQQQQENLKIQNHNLILFIESLERTSILCSLGIKNSPFCAVCVPKNLPFYAV